MCCIFQNYRIFSISASSFNIVIYKRHILYYLTLQKIILRQFNIVWSFRINTIAYNENALILSQLLLTAQRILSDQWQQLGLQQEQQQWLQCNLERQQATLFRQNQQYSFNFRQWQMFTLNFIFSELMVCYNVNEQIHCNGNYMAWVV